MMEDRARKVAGAGRHLWRCSLTVAVVLLFTGCAVFSPRSATQQKAPSSERTRDLADGRPSYLVKKGDTLYGIAFRAGLDYRRLAEWNGIKPPYTIYVGQVIHLKSPASAVSVSPNRDSRVGSWRNATKSHSKASAGVPANEANKTNSSTSKVLLNYNWRWPLGGKVVKRFSQSGSKGIDIVGNHGQSVVAAADGKVVYSGQGLIGYGNLVIIKHSDTYLSAYGNNQRLLVREGDYVKGGQAIAEIGRVAGKVPQLHFEIRRDGKPVDPIRYLPKR